ncbi:MobV family relaxase [Prevotella sp.]|uniref:MobV family relaxase n=1 Tax=Prevotella sp. TaxID=59823 RepID=UPI002E764908|nr:MobV family relaxase [Prevotella sp.]MEE0669300.1 MobV family relaxase [Prevotella sp.]
MQSNIPCAAIHVGKDKKSFSAQVGNEAERRGWDENVYRLKNADKEKNNHYNFSRKNLNFEIVKDGKIVPLGSNPIPLHERIQMRLDELGFKPYMDARHPNQVSKNSPNCTVGMIFSGDHDVLNKLAYGDQKIDTSDPYADCSHIVLQQGIIRWAKDTYDFACRKWGEENVISFAVHCDETSIHAHVQTIPVEKVKKRGRIGSQYVHNDNPDIVLSTKEWRALPKEERANYTKQTASKAFVERISYAKVWGETRKAKSEYLSQLHTDYHNEVGCKYGLARGIPYNELSEEEKRGRKHKNKVMLEAERQAKAALDKVEKYAVLATIDRRELAFPLLNVKYSVQEAMNTVEKELSIPIPAIIGQKAWREKRSANISAAIKSLVNAINEARDKQNEGVRTSVNKTYTYYMQNLNRLINENKSLEAENDTLKEENAIVKERISQLDENAVRRVAAEKDKVIGTLKGQLSTTRTELTNIGNDYNALLSKYRYLVLQWNEMKQQPEIIEAMLRVEKRKQEEAAIKREEQAKQSRHQSIIDRFIDEGHDALRNFSKTGRMDFNEQEANSIYYGIMATASKHNLPIDSAKRVETATDKFLAGMAWDNCGNFRRECVTSWTKLFATKDVVYTEPLYQNFLAFVDHMSCSADTYVSLGGSNGCADQLTNWNGTQKIGLGTPTKRKVYGLSQ